MRQILDWDSAFFARRIARVEPLALAAANATETEAWLKRESVDCVYLLVPADDQPVITQAGRQGFELVDVRVTLEAAVSASVSGTAPAGVRDATELDIPALQAIARVSHRDGRFYADGRFDPARCDEFYAEWITASRRGWSDHVFVADEGDGPIGYVSMHLRNGRSEMGLVGVAESARGRGVASRLVAAARAWTTAHDTTRLGVITQGRNTVAMSFYQAAGFQVTGIALWYHRWFPPQ